MPSVLFVGTRKGLFVMERRAGQWTTSRHAFVGVPVTMVFGDPRDGAWYAALEHGHFGVKMHKSTDAGQNWEEIAAPEYPPQPEGEQDINPFSGKVTPWKTQKVWALESAGPDKPGQLWCGTIPGGLFHSPDAGRTWNLVRSLWDMPERKQWFGGGADYPGIHSVCVDPRDSRRVRVAVSCAGIWETTDVGATWKCRGEGFRAAYMPPEQSANPEVQDVHRLVQCPAAPDVLWAQHHNGIFRSTDDGANWQEISEMGPSTFGFAVAVHPQQPDMAWFVPADRDEVRIPIEGRFVATRTRDGGRTSEVLRHGLPTEPAYDIVFRHGLDVSASDLHLAFGSTTGSLYVSEDLGDSWRNVSQHLPPIYCVRFAS